MQHQILTSRLPGQFVPEITCPDVEDTIKEVAKIQAVHALENSTMPAEGQDYKVMPPLSQVAPSVYLRAVRDLLNMDYATTDAEVPGRVAALYLALDRIFRVADEFEGGGEAMGNALDEIAGLCAAAFGQVQHGEPWRRKTAVETMLAQALEREVRHGL